MNQSIIIYFLSGEKQFRKKVQGIFGIFQNLHGRNKKSPNPVGFGDGVYFLSSTMMTFPVMS